MDVLTPRCGVIPGFPWVRAGALAMVLAVCMWTGSNAPLAAQSSTTRQSELRAAFLYNFAKLTEWPVASAHELVICSMGSPETYEALTDLSGRTAQGRSVSVSTVASQNAASECDIVFMGSEGGEQTPRPESLGPGVLTVGDSEDFVERGGMIRLRLKANRLHIEINLEAVEGAGLRMSSQLLALSTIIESAANR